MSYFMGFISPALPKRSKKGADFKNSTYTLTRYRRSTDGKSAGLFLSLLMNRH